MMIWEIYYLKVNIQMEKDGMENGENDFNGILLFKSEYLEGKEWNGKVHEHDDNGDLVGEYLKGKYVKKIKKYKQ